MDVQVILIRQGPDCYNIKLGAKGLPNIKVDIAGVPAEERPNEHIGGRLLMAAALACFINTMFNELNKANGLVKEIRASATTERTKDSTLRTKYAIIKIKVEVDVDGLKDTAFEAIRSTMMRGSLVTYSLNEGIEMDYEIIRVRFG
jgi:uncharacterized OsmC-like protein